MWWGGPFIYCFFCPIWETTTSCSVYRDHRDEGARCNIQGLERTLSSHSLLCVGSVEHSGTAPSILHMLCFTCMEEEQGKGYMYLGDIAGNSRSYRSSIRQGFLKSLLRTSKQRCIPYLQQPDLPEVLSLLICIFAHHHHVPNHAISPGLPPFKNKVHHRKAIEEIINILLQPCCVVW